MKVRQDKLLKPIPDSDDSRWALGPTLVCHVKRSVKLPLGCCPIDAKPMEVVEVLEENQRRPLDRVHGSTQRSSGSEDSRHDNKGERGGTRFGNILEEAGILRPSQMPQLAGPSLRRRQRPARKLSQRSAGTALRNLVDLGGASRDHIY